MSNDVSVKLIIRLIGGGLPSRKTVGSFFENPLAGEASWQNDLRIVTKMDLTNSQFDQHGHDLDEDKVLIKGETLKGVGELSLFLLNQLL